MTVYLLKLAAFVLIETVYLINIHFLHVLLRRCARSCRRCRRDLGEYWEGSLLHPGTNAGQCVREAAKITFSAGVWNWWHVSGVVSDDFQIWIKLTWGVDDSSEVPGLPVAAFIHFLYLTQRVKGSLYSQPLLTVSSKVTCFLFCSYASVLPRWILMKKCGLSAYLFKLVFH